MEHVLLNQPISDYVWRTRYRWSDEGLLHEPSIEATWDRVALAVSAAEAHHRDEWRERFRAILKDFRFLPGGRILAGAGTSRAANLFDCFAMGPVEGSVHGTFGALHEAVATLQAGGGVGVDLSTLQPADAQTVSGGEDRSDPVGIMNIWEAAAAVLDAGNVRRGGIRAALRCDHPDIEAFVDAKRTAGAAPHLSLSVMLGDDFMSALAEDGPWALVFPLGASPVPAGSEVCERVWSGDAAPQLCRVHRRIPARALWDRITGAQAACSEPGVVFVDRVNRANNLWYCEHLWATSAGGEIPLPPHGACSVGALNLARFVRQPFAAHPGVDFESLRAVAAVATRFLDDVYDISSFPLKAQQRAAHFSRRIGLGITGLADMFLMLGLRYGSAASIELTHAIMAAIRDVAYRASIDIAQEKGAFPGFDKIRYGASPFVLGLPHDIQDAIAEHGIRNSHLLAVAPAQTISLLANNVSCGIAPVAAFKATRRLPGSGGEFASFAADDAGWRLYQAAHGGRAPLPAHFVEARDVQAEEQLRLMAAVQSCVDNAVAMNVRLPEGADAQQAGALLRRAWELGLKGCAVRREAAAEAGAEPRPPARESAAAAL